MEDKLKQLGFVKHGALDFRIRKYLYGGWIRHARYNSSSSILEVYDTIYETGDGGADDYEQQFIGVVPVDELQIILKTYKV